MMLYSLDGVTFEAQPTNVHEVDRTSGQAWAEKPLVGAPPRFEATGTAARLIRMQGRLFPRMFGPGALTSLESMAESYYPHMLIRGDGLVLGWFAVRFFRERHSYLDREGVGRVIEFDIDLISVPTAPGAAALQSVLASLFA
jgi:phage protein U